MIEGLIGLEDDNFLIGNEIFSGVEEGETVDVGWVIGGSLIGEEFESFGLESDGELLEHFRDRWGFGRS